MVCVLFGLLILAIGAYLWLGRKMKAPGIILVVLGLFFVVAPLAVILFLLPLRAVNG